MRLGAFPKCITFGLCNRYYPLAKAINSRVVNVIDNGCHLKTTSNLSTTSAAAAKRQREVPSVMAYKAVFVPPASDSKVKSQFYDYFLVLDFEATCEDGKQMNPQEIIELPVLKINSQTLQVESTFHQYVQPRVHKELTPFCTKLTGIVQDMVDGQPHLEETLEKFDKWMLAEKLLEPDVKFVFVTCGDWDLMKMLPAQCRYFNIAVPRYMREWLNIKKAFAEVTSTYPKGMMPMLESLHIRHQGRHHSGIDDCKNIGNILIELLRRGYVGQVTRSR